jgi:NADH:quinone reductase (non-electrogenic)
MLKTTANGHQPAVTSAQAPKEDATLHEIVIVGGGAAGLELATGLGNTLVKRSRARITLVDKARAHLWKPLLYSVAAGSLDFDEHALDYLAQAHWHHFSYRFGAVIGLDRVHKQIQLAATHDEEGVEITPYKFRRNHHAAKKTPKQTASASNTLITARVIFSTY